MACPDLNDIAAGSFRYRDFTECSTTWKRNRDCNIPNRIETYRLIKQFTFEILLPLEKQFSKPELTFGFCSYELRRQISSGIYPSRDQHAGLELDCDGNLVCERGGFASDFYVPESNSCEIAQWIVGHTPFDRMYYYGPDRPIHVSVNEHPIGQIVTMTTIARNGNRMPRVVSPDKFLALTND